MRISSPIQLATLQIPIQNLKWLKNAKTRARTHNFTPTQKCPNALLKCFSGYTSQGCLFIIKCTCFDVDTAIIYSVIGSVHKFEIFIWWWINSVLQVASICIDNTVSQNVRQYAPRKGSLPAGQLQGRPNHFRHQKSTFSPHVMVFLGLKGDGTFFGYTKLQAGMNSQAYHTWRTELIHHHMKISNLWTEPITE